MTVELGQQIKLLREERYLTRENLCGSGSSLSVRQLIRIEKGLSTPTLHKLNYIAKALGISVACLTNTEKELPKRYQELKYQILRSPVYLDPERIVEREAIYDDISTAFYDQLPEEERLIIDCFQSLLDVAVSEDIRFGQALLEDYFNQVKHKTYFQMNDLIFIELYLICYPKFSIEEKQKDQEFYNSLLSRLLAHFEGYHFDELFVLNRVLISLFGLYLQEDRPERNKDLEKMLQTCKTIMTRIQDFQRMPIVRLMEWKYCLFQMEDERGARESYRQALMYAQLNGDRYLEEKLQEEWQKDIRGLSDEI